MPPLQLVELPEWLLRAVALMMGLIWGSFLNVVIHRLPAGMSLVKPASHCPSCQTPIPFYRNVPVVSWLLMRGKAPCCGAQVSARYVVIELLGGLLSLAVLEATVLPLGSGTTAWHALAVYVANFALCLGLLAAAFIDLEHMILPDSITFGGTAEQAGIDFDWKVTGIEQAADRVPREVFYLPAFLLLALIVWVQRRRLVPKPGR